MTDIVIHGIDNCDQVRKARSWLKQNALPCRFHDFRKDGLVEATLQRWLSHVPWDVLLNRRGLTWRKLDADQRNAIVDQATALELMLREPTIIKRPVLEAGDRLLVGFSEPTYQSLLTH